MTLKILSGVLNTRGHAKEGSATISFAPHKVSGDASGASLVTIGNRDKRYKDKPCTIFSLRELQVKTVDAAFPTGKAEWDAFKIDNTTSETEAVVRWEARSTSESRFDPESDSMLYEISYMIVGEEA
jgi:hypothetical protein